MADNNDEDLVSQIRVEGGEEGAAQIEQFADRGSAAFNKLGDAANKGAKDIGTATNKMGAEAKAATSIFNEFKNIKLGPGVLKDINSLKTNLASFTQSLGRTTQAVGRFAGRIALIGTAAQGAAIALGAAAANVAKSAQGQSTALKDQTDRMIDSNNASLSAEQAQIQLASTQRGLLRDLQTGKISYTDYSKAIRESNVQFQEQQRVAQESANAADRVKEANERLQKSLAKREAMNKLIDTFGGPLTSSLIAFGNQIEATRKSFLDGFGPGIAALVDTIGQTFTNNAPKIAAFFNEMGAKLQQFVSQNGPAIQLALENIGAAGAAIFEGLLAAGPPLLNFFNNQLVPAFQSIAGFFTSVAETINAAFGTKLTGGFLVIILLMAQLSGGLRLMFAVVRTGLPLIRALFAAFQLLTGGFSPFGIALKVVIALLIYLATKIDWNAWFATAQTAFAGITLLFNNLAAAAQLFVDNTIREFNTLVKAFTDFPTNVRIIWGAMWTALVESGKQFIANTIAEFDALVKFFTDFPANVQIIWNAAGQYLVDAFNSATNKVAEFLRSLRDKALEYLKPIADLIASILGTSGTIGGGSQPQGFAGGGSPGLVRGPGTSTSDSILARLSNNEWVMRAKAVRKYGIGFMRAVNEGRFKMPKFNMGGLNVIGPSIPRPAFADGGAVNSTAAMRPINLSIMGETFRGLLAPEDTASRLSRFAITRQQRSGGRKPNWAGG
jgi:hypothetical protein